MLQFFCGWRRKAGCVALVMACAVAGALVRGDVYEDCITVAFDRERAIRFTSEYGRLSTTYLWQDKHGVESVTTDGIPVVEFLFDQHRLFHWESYPVESSVNDHASESQWFDYSYWNQGPLGYREMQIRYWPLVLSLTLLSASLILRESRRKPA